MITREVFKMLIDKAKHQADYSCSGLQLAKILSLFLNSEMLFSWYVFDTQNPSFNSPVDYYENTPLLMDKVSKVEQFMSGVFIAVKAGDDVNWNERHLPVTEEDEGIQHEKAILEIRAFDTTYFEVYSFNKRVIEKICTDNIEILKQC